MKNPDNQYRAGAVLLRLRRGANLGSSANLLRHIVPKTLVLVHALMQHRCDTDRTVRQYAPIDIMMLIAAVIAVHTEFGRDSPPRDFP